MKVDIYSQDIQLEKAIRVLKKSEISEKNKELILKFDNDCIIKGLGKQRRVRYLTSLKITAKIINKDFDKVDKEDIKRFVGYIQSKEDYKILTKHFYKIMIKRFYKWLKGNDIHYPDEVNWMVNRLKKNERDLPGEGDLLTEEDIKKLIDSAKHPRDKALISMLYESGCRIGEIAGLRISNVGFDDYGIVIVVKGKTGSRKLRLIASTSYLINWLNIHPFKDNKESALWVNIGARNHHKHMSYCGIRNQLELIAKYAGVNKRCNPHLFRHSRATYMANHLTEFQMNQYFGWVQGSEMPSTYVHLSGKEVDNAILEMNGIKTEKTEKKESILKPRTCERCKTVNNHDSKYCSTCAAPLDVETAMEIEKNRKIPRELLIELLKDPKLREFLSEKMNSSDVKM